MHSSKARRRALSLFARRQLIRAAAARANRPLSAESRSRQIGASMCELAGNAESELSHASSR
jgi:hypothetical protein